MDSNKSTSKSASKKSIDSKLSKIDDQDKYCWVCHKDKINLSCNICPRSYHQKCLNNNPSYSQLDSYALLNDKDAFIKDNWVCFECELISKAESDEGKSECLKRISRDEFCELLSFACTTIKKSADLTFHTPVNLEHYTDYTDFIVHPMDFYKIEQYIKTKKYSSTEALLSDLKWIFHNCYIFNQATNPLTSNARYTLKVAKNEIYELETCPDCYRNIYAVTDMKDFFIRTCSHPHTLVLAKLKGHAPWPSKVVKYNKHTKEAEVRFFGNPHDKSWVTLDNCFLLSEIPSTAKVNKNQRNKLELAIKELEAHLELLEKNFPGLFKFAPPKTTLKPDQVYMIPLPDNITTNTSQSQSPTLNYSLPSMSTSLTKDTSSIENLNLENNDEKIAKPPKKKKIASATTTTVTKTPSNKTKQPIVEESKILIEQPDFSSLNDSDIEDKLVIDDESINENIKTRKLKRKREDSTSSSTKSSSISIKSNSTNQKRKSISTLDLTPQPIITKQPSQSSTPTSVPKKKLKKGSNQSTASNSPSNCLLNQNSQSQQILTNNEKVDQLIKQVQYYKNELDRSRALHIEEIKEMFENHKSEFRDLKLSLDAEKAKALSSLRKELESKHAKHIEEVKRKSWCTNCLKQALFFCCRMASYCSYDCQSQHWINHMSSCLQNKEKAIEQQVTTVESNQNSIVQDSTSKEDVTVDNDDLMEHDKIVTENKIVEATEKPSDQQLEISINKSETSLDKSSDKQQETTSVKQLDKPSDKQPEKTSFKPLDKSSDKQTETTSFKPLDKSSDKQPETTSVKQLDQKSETPLDKPSDKQPEKTSFKPLDKSSDKQPETTSVKQLDKKTDKQPETTSVKSLDKKSETPLDKPSDKPMKKTVEKSVDDLSQTPSDVKQVVSDKSSQVKKIKQIIEEKNEQNLIKEIKSKEIEQVSIKIDNKPVIGHSQQQIVKPKDRFLKKLNENTRSSLLNSDKSETKKIEKIETTPKNEVKQIETNSMEIKEDEKMDVDIIEEKKPIIEKNSNVKQAEKQIELTIKPKDDLEQMRLNLMKKVLENKKTNEALKEKSSTKDVDLNEKIKTPIDSKTNEQIGNSKTISDNQMINKKVENKLTEIGSMKNEETEDKIVENIKENDQDKPSKDNLKDLEIDKTKTSTLNEDFKQDLNLSEDSDEEDELRIEEDVKLNKSTESNVIRHDDEEDFDDDSNLMMEILRDKKSETNHEHGQDNNKKVNEPKIEDIKVDEVMFENTKDDKKLLLDEVKNVIENNDKLINQKEENEKITSSTYSPTHEDINQVKDDLITKVIESELKD